MKASSVEFVTSAAGAADFPRDGILQIAFVGRSNVGKSSLINALTRSRVARTSAAPGKTRLANVYRVHLKATEPTSASTPAGALRPRPLKTLYFVDLPGYGYARGGTAAAREFELLTRHYFEGDRTLSQGPITERLLSLAGVVLAIDARHPGLASDLEAHQWLYAGGVPLALVATKIDKIARAERVRLQQLSKTAFNCPALPVSAVTGEGLEELWKQISTLIRNHLATARQIPRASTSRRSRR